MWESEFDRLTINRLESKIAVKLLVKLQIYLWRFILKKMHESIYKEAFDHILPFWLDKVDQTYGGFYGGLSIELTLDKEAVKGGIATARLLWSLARAYRYQKSDELYDAMNHAYDFLINKVYDKSLGGVFWALDYKGDVIDNRKHVYAQSFAIYALSEYYLATNNEGAKALAVEIFELVETKGYDCVNEGYLEEFTVDWQLKDNEMLSENGVTAYFTMNTHLHILEAYTNLYRIEKSIKVQKALINLLQIFNDKIYDNERGIMKVFFDENWQTIVDLNSYGHDIEATWLLTEATDVLGIMNDRTKACVLTIGENIYNRAMREDGSIVNEIEDGAGDESRVWWAQVEALVGFFNLYTLTGEEKYYQTVKKMWIFIEGKMVDKRSGSEWYYGIEADGKVTEKDIVEPWKTPYHNLRGCIELLERLEKIKAG